ncbi:DUF58 domain-containing protein [Crocinitomicaceae bacterium]|jgi:uncharacterized protein (DUF58 family)|nr:DUF58 domain-containing protein [Crocinitomicaceae bacterium]
MPIDRLKLAQFGNLELLAKQVVEGFITGLHKSPFHGFSVEFAEHRLYNNGESTRHIDWKLYGRTERMYTKKYEEETNLRCYFVIDSSSSMYFKYNEISKFEFSVYSVASLMELLRRQRDAVGLSFFNDKVEFVSESKSSQSHHRRLYAELEKGLKAYNPKQKSETTTADSLHEIAELIHKRSLVVIFTDLLDDPNRVNEVIESLQHLKHNKHEVVLFQVLDNAVEKDLGLENRPYELIDMESGEKMKLNPNEIRETYEKRIKSYFEEIRLKCINLSIDFVEVNIANGVEPVLQQYLIKRQKLH